MIRALVGAILPVLAVAAPAIAAAPDGAALYARHCLSCHQADGGGVPDMQPPLIGSAVLAGPVQPLIALVLDGAADSAMRWANPMGAYRHLNDAEIAALLSHLRQRFVDADPITAAMVADARGRL